MDAIQRIISICIDRKDRSNAIKYLRQTLPGTPLAAICQQDLPSASETWNRIAELRETEDAETIAREVELRRKRLGSDPLAVIRIKVEREVVLASDIDSIYVQLLDAETDSARIADVRVKLLAVLSKKLGHLPADEKDAARSSIDDLAQKLADAGVADPLPYEILIDAEDVAIPDRNQQLISAARATKKPAQPSASAAAMDQNASDDDLSAIAKFARAFFKWQDGQDANDAVQDISEGLDDSPSSIFGYHLLSRIYLDSAEWSAAVAAAEKAKELAASSTDTTGRAYDNVLLDLDFTLGEAYVNLGHRCTPQALATYRSILQSDSSNIRALHGLGLTLISIPRLDEAARCFEKIVRLDAAYQPALVELAWVSFLRGEYSQALEQLLDAQNLGATFLIKYRLARTYWMLGDNYCHDTSFVQAHLIDAARLNPRFAPTFTLLGQYYNEVEGDRVRAAKCFTKAISIDSINEDAIKSLAFLWLESNDVERALALLQNAVGSMPRAGWAWKQLGIISLHLEKPVDAITQFQTALRIDAKDCILWTSLGEAYAIEGKYMAAIKALDRALELESAAIFPKYLKATVYHKLSLFPDAIASYTTCLEELEQTDAAQANPKTLVPALKGLAETLYQYAKWQYEDGGYGGCATRLLEAIRTCHRAMSIAPDLVCITKILGDSCLALASLVPDLLSASHVEAIADLMAAVDPISGASSAFEPPTLQDDDGALPAVGSVAPLEHILCGSAWSYHRAIMLVVGSPDKDRSSLVDLFAHDLGVAYFHSHKLAAANHESGKSMRLLSLAIKFVKIAIRIQPSKQLYWNALGVYTSAVDPKICQHALIKAAEVDAQNPRVWCNLGYFYLLQDDLDLAGQCFTRAQFVDPDWSLAWFGQAYVARLTGSIGLTCRMLASAVQPEILYAFGLECYLQPHRSPLTLTQASHTLLKCVERHSADPAAFNLYGLVLERLGQYEDAINAFAGAIRFIESSHETDLSSTEKTRCLAYTLENKARAECAAGFFTEAVATFAQCVDLGHADAYTYVGQGMASYFVGDLAESLHAFEKALGVCETLSLDDAANRRLKNDTTLLLSQVLYALGTAEHVDLAKQQLLQCIATDVQYVPAIISLCALGLVLGDWTLAQTAAAELIKLEPEVLGALDAEADWVLSSLFVLQGQTKTARGFLAKAVHRYPWKAARWSKLAELMYCHSPTSSAVAASVAVSGLSIFAASRPDPLNPVTTAQVSDMQRIGGLAMLSDSEPRRLRAGRSALCRAIRSSPSSMSNWLALGLHEAASAITHEPPAPLTCLDHAAVLTRVADAALALAGDAHTAEAAGWAHLLKAESLLQQGIALKPAAEQDSAAYLGQAVQVADSVINLVSNAAIKQAGYVQLGRALHESGDLATASQALRMATEIENAPTWTLPLQELARVYSASSQTADAMLCYEAALSLVDATPKAKLPILLRLAHGLMEALDDASASEHINAALQLEPSNAGARLMQTLLMVRSGGGTGKDKNKIAKNMALLGESDDAGYGVEPVLVEWLRAQIPAAKG
ncbi:hypothetical protein BC831DRAFT_395884 [Entophlyctis helioformis]|nr:hypothetical protein BC831DRAFT_395884 [Entophlyctis helioformis]